MLRSIGSVPVGSATTATAAMADGNTIFTITGGPIQILALQSVCQTTHQAVATTMQYQSAPTVGSAATISNASGSLSGVAAGTTVTLNHTSLATAPDIVVAGSGGVALGANVGNRIIVQAGTIKLVIATAGTGTWKHFIAYIPLAPGVTVVGT